MKNLTEQQINEQLSKFDKRKVELFDFIGISKEVMLEKSEIFALEEDDIWEKFAICRFYNKNIDKVVLNDGFLLEAEFLWARFRIFNNDYSLLKLSKDQLLKKVGVDGKLEMEEWLYSDEFKNACLKNINKFIELFNQAFDAYENE